MDIGSIARSSIGFGRSANPAKAIATLSCGWRQTRTVAGDSRLEPCLATVLDAGCGFRHPRTIGQGGKEIREFRVPALGDEPRHRIVSPQGSPTRCRNGAWRSVRVMAPSRHGARRYRVCGNGARTKTGVTAAAVPAEAAQARTTVWLHFGASPPLRRAVGPEKSPASVPGRTSRADLGTHNVFLFCRRRVQALVRLPAALDQGFGIRMAWVFCGRGEGRESGRRAYSAGGQHAAKDGAAIGDVRQSSGVLRSPPSVPLSKRPASSSRTAASRE